MCRRLNGMLVAAFVLSLIAGRSAALAQGVGGGSPTHTDVTLVGVGSVNDIAWTGAVGAAGSPVSVALDPQGPVWTEDLLGATLFHGDAILVEEHFVVTGDRPWTGWHEHLLTDSFRWSVNIPAITVNGIAPPGLAFTFSPDDPLGRGLLFSFDALPPGTPVRIVWKVIYAGTGRFQSAVTVAQYPVPEPGGLGLLATAIFAVARRRGS